VIFRFPFRWGPNAPASAATVTPTPLWTRTSVTAGQWIADPAPFLPRFERIVTEGDTGPQFQKVTDVVS
jgi:hypothetical protein